MCFHFTFSVWATPVNSLSYKSFVLQYKSAYKATGCFNKSVSILVFLPFFLHFSFSVSLLTHPFLSAAIKVAADVSLSLSDIWRKVICLRLLTESFCLSSLIWERKHSLRSRSVTYHYSFSERKTSTDLNSSHYNISAQSSKANHVSQVGL